MTRRIAVVGLLLTIPVIAGACGAERGPSSIAPAQSAGASAITGPSPVDASPEQGQTDTSWGRIWDEVPHNFPVFEGAQPAGGTSEAVSAALAVIGANPGDVASWMQAQLERAGYTTEGFNGPLEDGGFVLDSVGSEGCRIQVVAAPLGSLTSVIVRYGADCPAP